VRKGGGKAKGSSFERYVGVRLSLWLTEGERTDLFSRNVLSGGRFTNQAKKGLELAIPGDLAAAHPLAIEFITKFMVECKHHKNINLDVYLFDTQQKSSLAKIIDKALAEAKLANVVPLIVVKQNNRDAAVLMQHAVGGAALEATRHRKAFVYHDLHCGSMFMTSLDIFTSIVSAKRFMECVGGNNVTISADLPI
jgi:hypothetical protein